MDVLLVKPWITMDVFNRATREALESMQGEHNYVPSPAEFVALCRLAKSEFEDEAERETRKRLPPPAPVPDAWAAKTPAQRRAFWDREGAIGKARGRKRAGLIATALAFDARARPHIAPGDCEPTEAEIQAVLQEMAEGTAHLGPLAGALERVPIGPPYRTAHELAAHLPVLRDPVVSEAMAALNEELPVGEPREGGEA